MSNKSRSIDLWSLPLLFLWAFFLVAGLFPSAVYMLLREGGGVVTQNAMINSPHLLSLIFAGYVGLFAFHRCCDAGLAPVDAWPRGLFVFVVGMVAFLDFPFRVLLTLPDYLSVLDRTIIQGAAVFKLLAWGYLYSMVLRYYAVGNNRVFADLFPFASQKPRTRPQDSPTPRERVNDEVPENPSN